MSCQGNSVTALPMHRYAVALAAKDESWRWGFHSCNGLSAGADVRAWKDPHLWEDVMAVHAEAPIHAFVGGGDQICNDALWSTPGMQAWLHLDDSEVRTRRLLTAISVLPRPVRDDMPCQADTRSSLKVRHDLACGVGTSDGRTPITRGQGRLLPRRPIMGGARVHLTGSSCQHSAVGATQLNSMMCAAGEAEAGARLQ